MVGQRSNRPDDEKQVIEKSSVPRPINRIREVKTKKAVFHGLLVFFYRVLLICFLFFFFKDIRPLLVAMTAVTGMLAIRSVVRRT